MMLFLRAVGSLGVEVVIGLAGIALVVLIIVGIASYPLEALACLLGGFALVTVVLRMVKIHDADVDDAKKPWVKK